MRRLKNIIVVMGVAFSLCVIPVAHAAISGKVGIAVDAGAFEYYSVKDATTNAAIGEGVLPSMEYIYNGTEAERATVGSEFYAIKRVNITTASVNLAFGFTAKKVFIQMASANDDEVCIDWDGGTAVCPAANTAGNDRMVAGDGVILDDFIGTSISVIAASGTQTIYVRAWR